MPFYDFLNVLCSWSVFVTCMGRSKKNASDNRPLGNATTVGLNFEITPFAEGASREAFRATVQEGGCYKGYTNGTRLVLKTFKTDYYNKGLRVSQQDVNMQAYVKQLADDFNDEVRLVKNNQPCNFYVRVAKLDEFQKDYTFRSRTVFLKGERFLLEQEIKGTFQKFNSNSGWTCGDPVTDAFSHWSWVKTHSMVVCDLQGVRGGPGEPTFGGARERYYYLITDPAVNSSDKRFGVSDMGMAGIHNFFYKHVCGDLCRSLKLHLDRPKGISLLPVVKESSYDSLSSTDLDNKIFCQGGHRSSLDILQEESGEETDSDDDIVSISPADIYFTHNSISQRFSCGRYIEHTYEQLLEYEISIDAIPMMEIAKQDGKFWTYTGNRRLWVFRKLNSAGLLPRVNARIVQRRIPTKRFTTRNGGVSVQVRGRQEEIAKFAPAPRTAALGAWIFVQADDADHWLWHANHQEEEQKYDYPASSKMVQDGQGGVWVLCKTHSKSHWQLWHAQVSGEKGTFRYPKDSKMAGDGLGGVWLLCDSGNDNRLWSLWHANKSREVEKWQFPSSCTFAGDGQGGVWVLCDGALWHANLEREKQMYDKYPFDSKMTGDGQGGVWVLKRDTLWHANLQRQKLCWDYPETSDLEGDGQGGVWVFCKSNGTYAIWHATCSREVEVCKCPKRSKLASAGQGGLWILAPDRLLHLSLPDKIVSLYDFPSSAKLVRAVET